MNSHSKYFDKIKKLYDEGRVNQLGNYVVSGLITPAEYEEICGEPYEGE